LDFVELKELLLGQTPAIGIKDGFTASRGSWKIGRHSIRGGQAGSQQKKKRYQHSHISNSFSLFFDRSINRTVACIFVFKRFPCDVEKGVGIQFFSQSPCLHGETDRETTARSFGHPTLPVVRIINRPARECQMTRESTQAAAARIIDRRQGFSI